MSFMTLWAFRALSVTVQNNSPKKSSLLEIHKASRTSFAIKHFRLIWGGGARLERWSERVWPLCRPLRKYDAFNGAMGKTDLIYKTSRASPQTMALVQWQIAKTITALTTLWSAGEQAILDTLLFIEIKEKLWLCEAFNWVKCNRVSEGRKEPLTVRTFWLFEQMRV